MGGNLHFVWEVTLSYIQAACMCQHAISQVKRMREVRAVLCAEGSLVEHVEISSDDSKLSLDEGEVLFV